MNPFPRSLAALTQPLALAMWDFSWLERRWPGAGYEDWDLALDQFTERGYDSVRIDAYPHLVSADASRAWNLLPPWKLQSWGSHAPITVRVQPELNRFVAKCAERRIRVALSTWYQRDTTNQRELIASPRTMADQWIATVRTIEQAGLLDTIVWVDLCNEWPLDIWAPFFMPGVKNADRAYHAEESKRWMRDAITRFKQAFPDIACTVSNTAQLELDEPTGVDFLEPHLWMAMANKMEYYTRLEAGTEGDKEYESYVRIAHRGRQLYEHNREYWDHLLAESISHTAKISRKLGLPLATSEGWALVGYRDWPGLEWDWIKDLCARGVRKSIETERWFAICTSNFCGPQFRGMWRDTDWHRELTNTIKAAPLPAEMRAEVGTP